MGGERAGIPEQFGDDDAVNQVPVLGGDLGDGATEHVPDITWVGECCG